MLLPFIYCLRNGQFRFVLLSLVCCVIFVSLTGCGDSHQGGGFNRFLLRQSAPEPAGPIFKKQYNSSALSRIELDNLLKMSTYSGSAERYGVLVFRRQAEKRGVNPVVFSHQAHRTRFTCKVCHLELDFMMKKGSSDITREDNLEGRMCGACHNGEDAFSVNVRSYCDCCHVDMDRESVYQDQGRQGALVGFLPAQDYGDGIDWVEGMNSGKISPRNFLREEDYQESMPLPEHLELPMRWTTRSPRTLVSFPHKEHIKWLDCSNCHPDIFNIKQMGTVEFDKEKNLYGMYCGTCHMTVAFPMNGCSRCHPGQHDRP
jgi:c(7)-type cytochrome triheme protein